MGEKHYEIAKEHKGREVVLSCISPMYKLFKKILQFVMRIFYNCSATVQTKAGGICIDLSESIQLLSPVAN